MRILLVTREDPHKALTGVATYVRDLAAALGRAGHEIAHLHVSPHPAWRGPRLRWSRQGHTLTGIVAVPAAGRTEEERLRADVTWTEVEQLLAAALRKVRPAVLHVHDLSGIPASLVQTAREAGLPVVVTMHDFWPFCRQFLLVRPGLAPCSGSGGGRNCATYCAARPAPVGRRVARWADESLPRGVRDGVRWARALYRRRGGGSGSQFIVVNPPAPDRLPDPHIAAAYAKREMRMRETLLAADRLLTVSQSAKAMYVRHGYPEDRIHVLPLSLETAELTRRRLRTFEQYPIRFGFLGRVTPWKGAHLLAEAARGVPAERARFTFYGVVAAEDRAHLAALSGHHPGLYFAGRYTRQDLIRHLDAIDVAVFPSIMTETLGLVGLEAQAAGIPIIGAAHGAIAEYVRDGHNGLLFPPGDAGALRERILHLVDHPELIAQLSSAVGVPPRMGDHVQTVLAAYDDVVHARHRAAAPPLAAAGSAPAGRQEEPTA